MGSFTTDLNFQLYTVVLALFPTGCFVLVVLQLISNYVFRNENHRSKSTRSNQTLLYIIYTTSCLCGVVGFSLHISTMPQWCEKYGFLPCFCFLGLSKATLYVFFLRRAESAQGMKLTPFKRIIFRYVAPVYLFLYWITYCTLTSVVFAGKLVVGIEISNCVFAKGAWWFSIFAACVDITNAMGTLALFIHPLVTAMKQAGLTKQHQKEYIEYLGFVTVMKWNIGLTSLAAVSSVVTVFCFYVAQEWTWFFCLGDPFVNSLCVFLMLGPNRRFMKMIFCCNCKVETKARKKNVFEYVMEIDGIIVTQMQSPVPDKSVTVKAPPIQKKGSATEKALETAIAHGINNGQRTEA